MKALILVLSILILTACGHDKAVTGRPDSIQLSDGSAAFIIWPKVTVPGPQKWVWFAPVLTGALPNESQHAFYLQRLSEAGIAVVGVNVGEGYGSPKARASFDEFYSMFPSLGFNETGCMLLQSRGGLHGYTWVQDHPERIACVAGIYPIVSFDQYIGWAAYAAAWNVTEAWLRANSIFQNPIERTNVLTMPIFHIHGDADSIVDVGPARQFVANVQANGGNITYVEVPGGQHETSDAFFKSEALIQFLISNVQN